jgi:hypothetical protein
MTTSTTRRREASRPPTFGLPTEPVKAPTRRRKPAPERARARLEALGRRLMVEALEAGSNGGGQQVWFYADTLLQLAALGARMAPGETIVRGPCLDDRGMIVRVVPMAPAPGSHLRLVRGGRR